MQSRHRPVAWGDEAPAVHVQGEARAAAANREFEVQQRPENGKDGGDEEGQRRIQL